MEANNERTEILIPEEKVEACFEFLKDGNNPREAACIALSVYYIIVKAILTKDQTDEQIGEEAKQSILNMQYIRVPIQ